MAVNRDTVDLAGYPDLVVIYLGMRVNSWRGLATLFRIGPQINASAAAKPDGLLGHEFMVFSLLPPHLAFRQYWRDFDSMMAFTKAQMHDGWWQDFLRDPKGTGFWHETYCMRGGMEAIYNDMPKAPGFGRFAPLMSAKGPMHSARERLLSRQSEKS